MLLCIRNCNMCHALLVAALVYSQMARILVQCLSKANYHAMSEDGKDTIYKGLLYAIKLNVLLVQELDNSLTYCHFGLTHNYFLLKSCVFPFGVSLFLLYLVYRFHQKSSSILLFFHESVNKFPVFQILAVISFLFSPFLRDFFMFLRFPLFLLKKRFFRFFKYPAICLFHAFFCTKKHREMGKNYPFHGIYIQITFFSFSSLLWSFPAPD